MSIAAVVVAATLASPSWAQTQSTDHVGHHPAHAVAQPLADGEVRKVDKEAGKLTLKHGPIANLDMPEMTMVFRVKDPAILDQVRVGDKVQFAADKVNGVLTLTNLEAI
jgi:Cu/Ag efflux protein CusF